IRPGLISKLFPYTTLFRSGNVGLILGVVLLINAINVNETFYTTDWPMKILASFLLFIFLWFDEDISRIEGIVFLIIQVVFIIYRSEEHTSELQSRENLVCR